MYIWLLLVSLLVRGQLGLEHSPQPELTPIISLNQVDASTSHLPEPAHSVLPPTSGGNGCELVDNEARKHDIIHEGSREKSTAAEENHFRSQHLSGDVDSGIGSLSDHGCPICLRDYNAEDEHVRCPNFSRRFHKKCMHEWFSGNPTCPNCPGDIHHIIPQPHCPICLAEVGDQLFHCPLCKCPFHQACIDTWLLNKSSKSTCPHCRKRIDKPKYIQGRLRRHFISAQRVYVRLGSLRGLVPEISHILDRFKPGSFENSSPEEFLFLLESLLDNTPGLMDKILDEFARTTGSWRRSQRFQDALRSVLRRTPEDMGLNYRARSPRQIRVDCPNCHYANPQSPGRETTTYVRCNNHRCGVYFNPATNDIMPDRSNIINQSMTDRRDG